MMATEITASTAPEATACAVPTIVGSASARTVPPRTVGPKRDAIAAVSPTAKRLVRPPATIGWALRTPRPRSRAGFRRGARARSRPRPPSARGRSTRALRRGRGRRRSPPLEPPSSCRVTSHRPARCGHVARAAQGSHLLVARQRRVGEDVGQHPGDQPRRCWPQAGPVAASGTSSSATACAGARAPFRGSSRAMETESSHGASIATRQGSEASGRTSHRWLPSCFAAFGGVPFSAPGLAATSNSQVH
jgi:hypothetical protein